MLHAYYDRALNPPTFDSVSFLMWLEHERIGRGEDEILIEVVPGPREGFAHNRLWPESTEQRQQMWDAVSWPMMGMLPSCLTRRMTNAGPETGSIGYGRYCTSFERFLSAYSDGIRPLRPKFDAVNGPFVTFTLRESAHWPARNSQLKEWVFAAYELVKRRIRVVVVRDTLKADEPLGGLETSPRAARDLEARAVLYRSALVNLFVSNGPAWFCLALDAPTIILRPATDGAGRLSSVRVVADKYGLRGGLPNAPAHQRLIWYDDARDNIVSAAMSFIEKRQAA